MKKYMLAFFVFLVVLTGCNGSKEDTIPDAPVPDAGVARSAIDDHIAVINGHLVSTRTQGVDSKVVSVNEEAIDAQLGMIEKIMVDNEKYDILHPVQVKALAKIVMALDARNLLRNSTTLATIKRGKLIALEYGLQALEQGMNQHLTTARRTMQAINTSLALTFDALQARIVAQESSLADHVAALKALLNAHALLLQTHGTEIKTLTTRLTTATAGLSARISALASTVGVHYSTVQAAVQALNDLVSAQHAYDRAVGSSLTALEVRLTTATAGLSARISALASTVGVHYSTVQAAVQALNDLVSSQHAYDQAMGSSLTALEVQLTTATAGLSARISALASTVGVHYSAVQAAVQALNDLVAAQHAYDRAVGSSLTALEVRLTTATAGLSARISALDSTVGAHYSTVQAAVQALNDLVSAQHAYDRAVGSSLTALEVRLTTATAGLSARISALASTVGVHYSTVQVAIKVLNDLVSAQHAYDQAMGSSLTALEVRLTTATAGLSARISALASTVGVHYSTVQAAIKVLNDLVFAQHAYDQAMGSSLTALEVRLTTATAGLSARISALASTVGVHYSTVQAAIKVLNDLVSAQHAYDQAMGSSLARMRSGLSSLTLTVAAIGSSLTATATTLSARIQSLLVQISSLTARISYLEALHAPPPAPTGVLTVVAGKGVDGLITNGDLTVYTVNEATCLPDKAQSSTKTDAAGKFSVNLHNLKASQILLFEVKNGHYFEEATRERVDLRPGQRLYAIDRVEGSSGSAVVTKTVSGLTNLMYAIACHRKLKTWHQPGVRYTIAQALAFARSQADLIAGGIQVVDTDYKDVTSSRWRGYDFDRYPESFWYSFFVAGISGMIADLNKKQGTAFKSIDFWQALEQDVLHDGLMNGVGARGNVGLGATPLYPDMIRTEAMRAAVAFKANRYNLVTVRDAKQHFDTHVRAAHTYNAGIYAGTTKAAVPIDNVPPVIRLPAISGALLTQTITATIIDDSPIKDVHYAFTDHKGAAVGGILYVDMSTQKGSAYDFLLPPLVYGNSGAYRLTVTASDGHLISTKSIVFQIVKSAPQVQINQYQGVSTGAITISGQYALPYPQYAKFQSARVTINGIAHTPSVHTKTRTFSSSKKGLASDRYVAVVRVCDDIGNCGSATTAFAVDSDAPKVSAKSVPPSGGYKSWAFVSDRFSEGTGHGMSVADLNRPAATIRTMREGARWDTHMLVTSRTLALNGVVALESALQRAGVYYFAFNVMDVNRVVHTPNDELTITVTYSTAQYSGYWLPSGDGRWHKVYPTTTTERMVRTFRLDPKKHLSSGSAKRIVLPITVDYFGKELTQQNIHTDHIAQIRICDKAGNCTDEYLAFKIALETPAASALSVRYTTNTNDLNAMKDSFDSRFSWGGSDKNFGHLTVSNDHPYPLWVRLDSASNATILRSYVEKYVNVVPMYDHYRYTLTSYACGDDDIMAASAGVGQLTIHSSHRGLVSSPQHRTASAHCTFKDYDGRHIYRRTVRSNFVFTNCVTDAGSYRSVSVNDHVLHSQPANSSAAATTRCSYGQWVQSTCYGGNSGSRPCSRYQTFYRSRPVTVTEWQDILKRHFVNKTITTTYDSDRTYFSANDVRASVLTLQDRKMVTSFRQKRWHNSAMAFDSWVRLGVGDQLRLEQFLQIPPIHWFTDKAAIGDHSRMPKGVYRHDQRAVFTYNPIFNLRVRSDDGSGQTGGAAVAAQEKTVTLVQSSVNISISQ